MFTWKRAALVSAGFILLLLVAISMILPGIVADRARQWVATETGRVLTVGDLDINPLTLTVEVRDLSVSDKDAAAPLLSWELLRLSLSPQSLFYRAPILRELRLDHPALHLERLDENRFNFSDLLPANGEPDDATAPDDEPFAFSISNLSINGGTIDLVDSSVAEPVRHTVRDLNLSLPIVGNLPNMVENPAQPLFSAVINDSPLQLEGALKPFSDTQELVFDLDLERIHLPTYLAYLPVELPVQVRNGLLSVALDVVYRVSAEAGGELEVSGRCDLAALEIRDRLSESLFFLPLLQVEIAPSQLLAQQLHLRDLRIYNLEVQLKRDAQGQWNHARMVRPADTSPQEPAATNQDSGPFKLLIDTFKVRDGVVVFIDEAPELDFKTVAREINIDVSNFALDATTPIPVTLALETERSEQVHIDGHFLLDPFALTVHVNWQGLDMGAYEPYYHDTYAGPLGGRLDGELNLLINPEQSLQISDGHFAWHDARLAFNDQEGITVPLLEVSGLSFALDENRLEIDSVLYQDGRVNFSRDAEGHWSFLSQNFPVLAKLTESPDKAASAAPQGPGLSYHIGEFAIRHSAFDIQDRLPATPAALSASEFNLVLRNLAAPERVESPFTFSTRLQQKGHIESEGTASLAGQSLHLTAHLRRIPLAPFAPYLAEHVDLLLTDGFVDAGLTASLQVAESGLQVEFGGDLGIGKFYLLDGRRREDLLKWERLQVAGIKGRLTPFELAIETVTLSDYFAKVLIDEEGRVNLVEAFRGDSAAQADGQAGKVETPSTEAAAAPDAEIQVGRIVLQGGRVDFTDRNLPRPFHADMRELGGRIDGLDSNPEARARVDLRGSLRNQSPLNITGELNPLAQDLYLDITLNFNDIELPPFSPYSGNYVGYLIKKGKLNLALEYFIEDQQLKASNKVFLDQFDFGDAVDSPQATSLPVKLAVALLKDGKGEIHLDIPVYGSLDDPQFSIASVVWTVIKNLLVKAATSPFALLGALVGGSDQDFSNIRFHYGSARLTAEEQEKLQKMAQALLERPSIDVEISGFIDPENDPEGYRRETLAAQIRRLKYLELVDRGTLPEEVTEEEVTIPAEEYADYLWEVYSEADFPKPRNFLGMTKKLPEDEMEKLIFANTEVTDTQMAELAQSRARAVQGYLIEGGSLPRERIFLKDADITQAPEEETTVRARVELGASVR